MFTPYLHTYALLLFLLPMSRNLLECTYTLYNVHCTCTITCNKNRRIIIFWKTAVRLHINDLMLKTLTWWNYSLKLCKVFQLNINNVKHVWRKLNRVISILSIISYIYSLYYILYLFSLLYPINAYIKL